jgi:hypothetical protein
MAENSTSKRMARFPGKAIEDRSPAGSLFITDTEPGVNKRRTQFPGKLSKDVAFLTAASLNEPIKERQKSDSSGLVSLGIPLPINAPDGVHSRPLPAMEINRVSNATTIVIRRYDPWDTYKLLRPIGVGGRVFAACTKSTPHKPVTLKEIPVQPKLHDLIKCQHQTLVAFLGLYEYDSKTMAVWEFMHVSLRQIIASAYPLEEIHVSAVCNQVSPCGDHYPAPPKTYRYSKAFFIYPGVGSFIVVWTAQKSCSQTMAVSR